MGQGDAPGDAGDQLEARAFACPACGAIAGRLVRRILDVDRELGQLDGAVYTCAVCERAVRITVPRRPPPPPSRPC